MEGAAILSTKDSCSIYLDETNSTDWVSKTSGVTYCCPAATSKELLPDSPKRMSIESERVSIRPEP